MSKEMTKREVVYNIHMALTGAFCQPKIHENDHSASPFDLFRKLMMNGVVYP